MAMLYLESPSTDPYFNLAMEEYVLNKLPKEHDYFILYQNNNAIIIGKHQNAIEEVNLPYVRKNRIDVVRRLSGGGAVFHDLGNLNFTFIKARDRNSQLDLASFCKPVVKALASLGIKAEISGRNDMVIDGRKFSGNAQYIRSNRVMHHGTLMFDSDLKTLSLGLKPSVDEVISRSLKSVRSPVTNIKDHLSDKEMSTADFKEVLKQFMIRENNMEPYVLTSRDREEISDLQRNYETWDWNFGRSPAYSIKKERHIEGCGKIQLYMEVKKGLIEVFSMKGDYCGAGNGGVIEQALTGCNINESSLKAALEGLDMSRYFKNLSIEQFIEIILE